jgi:integrase
MSKLPTFAEFATEFLRCHVDVHCKPSKVRGPRAILKQYLLPTFGHLRLDEIGHREVVAWQAELLTPKPGKRGVINCLSRKRVTNLSSVLRRCLKFAVEQELLGRAPRVPHLRFTYPEIESFTPAEAERLLEAAPAKWRTMILMALRSGLRVGELRALQWADLDLKRGTVDVRRAIDDKGNVGTPKSGKARTVPLAADLVTALQAHPRTSEWVFGDRPPVTRASLKWPLWQACDSAGLERCGWHKLRHTFATTLIARNANVRVVQRLLGHSTVLMTERYTVPHQETLTAAIGLLASG